jgi:hypothetical protein
MTRNVTASFRRAAEASFNDEVDLVFLTISHPTLGTPIRVVWDTVDFIFGGNTFLGFPFDIELLSDDEQPPTARLQIQNVSPRIGDTVRALMTPPSLKIELLSSADFNLTVTPRTPIGSPTVIYSADKLFLINVSVDIMMITGQIVGWDFQQRVWPAERATKANFPGLFRS